MGKRNKKKNKSFKTSSTFVKQKTRTRTVTPSDIEEIANQVFGSTYYTSV